MATGQRLAHLEARVAAMPRSPGVYLWKDGAGQVVYVGKAVDLRSRTSSYLDPATPKHEALLDDAHELDFIAVTNEKEALVLEQTLIKRHRPRYNVRLTDDKQYPYIALTNEPYPRLVKVHQHLGKGATHFGPFPDGYGAYNVVQALNDLLPLRRCRTLPKEKCLYYDIGKCIAPCIQACTDQEYDLLVEEAKALLGGKTDHMLDRLQADVAAAAERQDYERAARLRDQLHGLQGVLERQHMAVERLEERDIAALALRGASDLGVAVILHQRDGKVVGQSPFVLQGVRATDESHGVADFLRGYYQDRRVPRILAIAGEPADAAALEADLRLLAGRPVTVEAPERGDKRRWVDVAIANARLRLEQEVAAMAKRGIGAVEALQKALGLAEAPRRIEGFDISHRAGEFTRAAMVSFWDGEPDKASYRTFGMKTVGAAAVAAGTATEPAKGQGREVDDFAAIEEAVGRRYRGVLERGEDRPHLILIDGGPGQLAAARKALAGLGLALPVCSLAKQEELVFLPGRMKPVRLARNDPALQLLQRVRDESHRFGITQVQRKAVQSVTQSPLDAVPGIGPKRRAELVTSFGGLEGLRAASVEDLMRVKGVTRAMAEKVRDALALPGEQAPGPGT